MVKRIFFIVSLLMLLTTTVFASPTKEENVVVQNTEAKQTIDDRVSASNTAKVSQKATTATSDELQQVTNEMASDFKQYKKSRPLLPAVAAVASVGALYVGSHNWHDLQDKVGVDRAAHFAVSYIINDQLQKNCGMNKFWGTVTTIAIGAAKEKWVDNKWDGGDFTADCLGAMLVNIKF